MMMFPQDRSLCRPQMLDRYSGDLGIKPKWKLLTLSGILNDSIYIHLSFTKRNPHEAAQQHIDHVKRRKLAENNRAETLKITSLNDHLKQNPWPLEKSIFESLPPRLRKGACFRLFPVTLSGKLWFFFFFPTLILRSVAQKFWVMCFCPCGMSLCSRILKYHREYLW